MHPVAFKSLRQRDTAQDQSIALMWRSNFADESELKAVADFEPPKSNAYKNSELLIDSSPTFDSITILTGHELMQLAGLNDANIIAARNDYELQHTLLSQPILLAKEKPIVLTGNIAHAKRLISQMQRDKIYPALMVTKRINLSPAYEPAKPQRKATIKRKAPNKTNQKKILKGEIERQEAAKLGISAAALRKRRSRANRALENEKAQS